MERKVMNVKTNDTVVVITGKDAGKQGKVLATLPKKDRIVVSGVNIISRHTKPKSAKDSGGIVKREGTIDVSNVMVVCPTCGKATRIKHSTVDGKSTRVCKCGAVLDKKYEKAQKKTVKKDKKVETSDKEATKKKAKISKETKEIEAKVSSVKNKAEGATLNRKTGM